MRQDRLFDTATMAGAMRDKIIRPATREILISRISGSDQEGDLTVPPNCGGLGRIRHFRRATSDGWPDNPLPIDPAQKSLGLPRADMIEAQVFQNAACAWRCWYCFVPFNMLNGDAARAEWITPEALVAAYLAQPDRPAMIDLSGGSPDLTPEWIVWMMEALEAAGVADNVYLWSDDNLSTDYVFSKLDQPGRERLARHPHYGRVCCFKGFDEASFSFNTQARPEAFVRQFEIFQSYLDLGLDLYGYVTLTGPDSAVAEPGVKALVSRLRAIDEYLPLRVIPLEIADFAPTRERDQRGGAGRFAAAADVQSIAIATWNQELERHYGVAERATSISDVPLGARL